MKIFSILAPLKDHILFHSKYTFSSSDGNLKPLKVFTENSVDFFLAYETTYREKLGTFTLLLTYENSLESLINETILEDLKTTSKSELISDNIKVSIYRDDENGSTECLSQVYYSMEDLTKKLPIIFLIFTDGPLPLIQLSYLSNFYLKLDDKYKIPIKVEKQSVSMIKEELPNKVPNNTKETASLCLNNLSTDNVKFLIDMKSMLFFSNVKLAYVFSRYVKIKNGNDFSFEINLLNNETLEILKKHYEKKKETNVFTEDTDTTIKALTEKIQKKVDDQLKESEQILEKIFTDGALNTQKTPNKEDKEKIEKDQKKYSLYAFLLAIFIFGSLGVGYWLATRSVE